MVDCPAIMSFPVWFTTTTQVVVVACRADESHASELEHGQLTSAILRRSCVNAGYFSDPFVKHFVRRPARRSPVINRGPLDSQQPACASHALHAESR